MPWRCIACVFRHPCWSWKGELPMCGVCYTAYCLSTANSVCSQQKHLLLLWVLCFYKKAIMLALLI